MAEKTFIKLKIKYKYMPTAVWTSFKKDVLPQMAEHKFKQEGFRSKTWYKYINNTDEDKLKWANILKDTYGEYFKYIDIEYQEVPQSEITKEILEGMSKIASRYVKEIAEGEEKGETADEFAHRIASVLKKKEETPEEFYERTGKGETSQSKIIPMPEPPATFYIIADVGSFQVIDDNQAILGKFKVYPFAGDGEYKKLLNEVAKPDQLIVKLHHVSYGRMNEKPDGNFSFIPAGLGYEELFEKAWQKKLKKLKSKFAPKYLKENLKKLKATFIEKFSKTQSTADGEWFYEGEICPGRNGYFDILNVNKVIKAYYLVCDKCGDEVLVRPDSDATYKVGASCLTGRGCEGHYKTSHIDNLDWQCSNIVHIEPFENELYIKYWTAAPQVLTSFEPMKIPKKEGQEIQGSRGETGWYKAGVLSSYWIHSQIYNDEYYADKVVLRVIHSLQSWKDKKIVVPKFQGTALPHQIETLQFLESRKNALLALGVGTGKTLISLLYALRLFKKGKIDKCVIFCNILSKDEVWKKEIIKWFGAEFYRKNIQIIEGTPRAREVQWRTKKRFIFANYEQAKNKGCMKLAKRARVLVVADEVTSIKNIGAARTKAMIELPATYKIGLSGEPQERNLQELHTIEKWLGTKIFGTFESYRQAFMGSKNKYKIEQKMKSLNEYLYKTVMIRYTSFDVDPDLPPPEIIERAIEYTGDVLDDYNSIANTVLTAEAEITDLERKIRWADKDTEEMRQLKARKSTVSRSLLPLLKITHRYCDHPFLLRKGQSRSDTAIAAYKGFKAKHTSPKMDVTLDIIANEVKPEEKIVIFSEYPHMCDLLADKIESRTKRGCLVVHGETPKKDRPRLLTKFEHSKKYNTLLMSDIGKYGLNFPFANVCIIYDLPWNATTIKQRIGRLVRLGKRTATRVYIPYVVNFAIIEQKVRTKLNSKAFMSSVVIDGIKKETYKEWLESKGKKGEDSDV